MNKKGFTLVELLAVIVIIGLLSLIVYSSISRSNQNAREKMLETKKETASQQLILWGQDNRVCFVTTASDACFIGKGKGCTQSESIIECNVSFSMLAQNGLIKYDEGTKIINPVTNKPMNDDIITLQYNINSKSFSIKKT